jgi:hypothetical protein
MASTTSQTASLLALLSLALDAVEGPNRALATRIALEQLPSSIARALGEAAAEIREQILASDDEEVRYYAVRPQGEIPAVAFAAHLGGRGALLGSGMVVAIDTLGRRIYEDRVW